MSGEAEALRVFDPATIERFHADGSWDPVTVADQVRDHATGQPDRWAFRAPDRNLTWREYDELSTRLAAALVAAGPRRGEFLGTFLTGGSLVHLAYLAAQKAGLVTAGIGPRAGDQEAARLLDRTACRWLLTRPVHRGRQAGAVAAAVGGRSVRHVVADLTAEGLRLTVDGDPLDLPGLAESATLLAGRALDADELFFVNSTSGTTGRSKCVTATLNTRKYFSPLAIEAGELTGDDVVFSVLPAPYGFGLWSAHFVPARLGATTVLCGDFDAAEALRTIERERVTMLAAVTSQFVMMLNSPVMSTVDLSSLRVVFTGGERVHPDRAAEFERRTGAAILQFYGSNESGPLSVTRISDSRDKRLTTVGRPVAAQQVRLFDERGRDVTADSGPGQCGGSGPGVTPGYFDDAEANAKLFRQDGWLLTGDVAFLDDDGYLHVAGRTADVIIRGGQNISAVEVEAEVGTHPAVAQVAAVGVADDVLGERVCAVVVTTDGTALELDSLREHLRARGVSKHCWPEYVQTRPELPLSPGGKLDKKALSADLAARPPRQA